MRLGEFRTKTRELDNKLIIYLSNYEKGTVKKIDIDMITENKIFLREVGDLSEKNCN